MAGLLGKSLPTSVTINGLDYEINTDYRIGIEIETMLRRDGVSEQFILRLLQNYYPIIPDNLHEAIDKALWFFRCGRPAKTEESEAKQRYKRKESSQQTYSYEQDGAFIYAAFKEQFDIDLSSDDPMHWWQFNALFESLGENTKMAQIMHYRAVNMSDVPKERKAFYSSMKKLYMIHDGEKDQTTLEERNQRMKEYVQNRLKEIENSGETHGG